eukprot:2539362-Rhodomonas_salina.1
MAVWGRCKANYNVKEWDPGAFALFEAHLRTGKVQQVTLGALNEVVGACLTEGRARGEGPDACLLEFLQREGETKETYFAYTRAQQQGSSADTDACQVFSGPASAGSTVFQACLDEYGEEEQAAQHWRETWKAVGLPDAIDTAIITINVGPSGIQAVIHSLG